MQFRWEVFNVINHVNFNAPMTALNSATSGRSMSRRAIRVSCSSP